MVKTEVYKSSDGSLDAYSVTTGTQKGKSGAPKIDGNSHFVSESSLRLLANHLITYIRLMQNDKRWKEYEDKPEITFPRDIKIVHPSCNPAYRWHFENSVSSF